MEKDGLVMVGLSTLASVACAVVIALLLGPLLARIARQFLTGRGATNLLIQARGSLLPFLVAPLIHQSLHTPFWLTVGLVVGMNQGVAVARWGARRSGAWSNVLLGAMALGRSGHDVLSAHVMARGAIVATLALTTVEVITVEALLTALHYPTLQDPGSIGARLFQGSAITAPFFIIAGTSAIFLTEMLASLLLQRRGG